MAMTLETIVALAKRRGFIFPSAEIYGGVNGIYDCGPLGTLMKENIRASWRSALRELDQDIVFMEGALIGPEALWKASGHVENFHDPMVDCTQCKHRYRADDIDISKGCPHCGMHAWTEVRQFHMMFSTQVGAATAQATLAYLRPETAQAIFTNFKNVYATSRVKIPFGIAQIGKAFRNEITPKQFLFRMREFEQMELEWFCTPETAPDFFHFWLAERTRFYETIGLRKENLRIRAHEKSELSHYSQMTSDFEYQFPFGWKELEGVAYRGNFDLTQHSAHSGKDLSIFDEETKTSFVPHVVECSVGVDRLMLALLCDAYYEDIVDNETRVVLKFNPKIAPVKAAFMPLTKAQIEPMHKLYSLYKRKGLSVVFDVSGSIGKRYRRQDEIGTPYCFTYDFESPTDLCITIRHRDSMLQERVSFDTLESYLL